MRLLLIRHGQTPDNVSGFLGTTVPGPGLTALGRRQAAALPGAVTEPVAAIAVSSLVRTHLTAEPFARARGITLVEFDGFREIEAGACEGRRDHAAITKYVSTFAAWAAGDLDIRIDNAEDGHTFLTRYDDALAAAAALVPEDGALAVFSHGAAIRTWVGVRAKNVDGQFTMDRFLDNTGMAVLEGSVNGGWQLRTWQDEAVTRHQLSDADIFSPARDRV